MELNLKNIINQIDGCVFIGRFEDKLSKSAFDNDIQYTENQLISMYKFLDAFFKDVDLSLSYREKLVITHEEPIPVDTLMALHHWFSRQCCDLSNIYIVFCGNVGIKEWYKKYLNLNGAIGFNVVEAPYIREEFLPFVTTADELKSVDLIRKDLKFYFSFYGGRGNMQSPSVERDFNVAMLLAKTSEGHIDYLSGFGSTDSEFDGYSERMTNFADRALVDQLLDIKHNSNYNAEQISYGPAMLQSFTGTQWDIDQQSVCSVIRETYNTSVIPTVSEKTLRTFMHFLIPLPISGVGAVDQLKKLGFSIDYDIIDYDYQYEPVYYTRLNRMIEQLNNLKKYKLSELEDYVLDKSDLLCYNYNYIVSGDVINNIKQNLIKELSE